MGDFSWCVLIEDRSRNDCMDAGCQSRVSPYTIIICVHSRLAALSMNRPAIYIQRRLFHRLAQRRVGMAGTRNVFG